MSRTLPARAFNSLLAAKGTRLTWAKSHSCPCVGGGPIPNGGYRSPGTADPACRRCHGYGTYWDAPIGPFMGLLTYFASAPSPIEPGIRVDERFGQYQDAQPVVTVPSGSPSCAPGSPDAATMERVWQEASLNDIFVEVDATTRYNALLQQGADEALPFQQNLSVAPTGAVTVYDPVNRVTIPVDGYEVAGAGVTLPAGVYPDGTAYAVEFIAAPIYVAHKAAGALPHTRPFGGGTEKLPRRFHIQALDYWTRLNVQNAGTSFPLMGC